MATPRDAKEKRIVEKPSDRATQPVVVTVLARAAALRKRLWKA
jgi:hypothetical protein